MIKSDNKLFYKIIFTVFAIIILWFSAAVFDHSRVFEKEKPPVFCSSRLVNDEISIYNGIGYSYTLTSENGKFKRVDFENFLGANEYLVNCG